MTADQRTPRDVTADGPPFRIDANGVWWHGDVQIIRKELVKLFASILRREDDGTYWIWNPGERCHVQVDDVPYVLNSVAQRGDRLVFTSSLDEEVTLDAQHPLAVRNGKPYIMVRAGCEGRIATHVYYELAELAEKRGDMLVLRSDGVEFSLGSTDAAE